MLAPDRSRCRLVMSGVMLRTFWGQAVLGDWGQAVLGGWACSAGSVLRSLRRLWEDLGFRAVREGFLVFASKARFGPIPLRLRYLGALRGIGPARAGKLGGGMDFSRCARRGEGDRFQCLLRTGPAAAR